MASSPNVWKNKQRANLNLNNLKQLSLCTDTTDIHTTLQAL